MEQVTAILDRLDRLTLPDAAKSHAAFLASYIEEPFSKCSSTLLECRADLVHSLFVKYGLARLLHPAIYFDQSYVYIAVDLSVVELSTSHVTCVT